MKKQKTLWLLGLSLLALTVLTAYFYTREYIGWNVPLYGVAVALLFLEGAGMFALLAAAKERPKKRVVLSALPGGAITVGGVFILSYVINITVFHEGGARFASIATAAFGCLLALYGVLRLKKLTGVKFLWRPLVGVVLALSVFAAGMAGTLFSGFVIPGRYNMDTLQRSAEKELSAASGKLYGIDALQSETGALTVAFIGGSLTEGRITYKNGAPHSTNAWTDDVLRFLENKYPRKTLRAVNAGKGGTNSAYGASRFGHDVEPYAPDLLFIEFSVNDSGSLRNEPDAAGAAESQLYLEYMLRRCLQMKKEPVVIYLHTPFPTETDTDLYRLWKEGADLKTALCGAYGVPVIDIYETLHEKYEAAGVSLLLEDWLADNGWYYRSPYGGLDVHPSPAGYRSFYSAAVVGALEQNWDALIRQPEHAPVYCKNAARYLSGTYSYVEIGDPRLSFSAGWRTYKNRLAAWLDVSEDAIPYGFLEYPHFAKGIMQAERLPGASFTYETDADTLGMAMVSSVKGLSASVLCDGEAAGALSCGSVYGNMEFPAGTVSLPDDDAVHTVTVRVEDPTEEAYLFRFGYLIEFRYGEN